MKKRDLQKADLDRIGRKLLETTRVADDELDQIVGSPQLFDAVKARIKAEERQQKRERQPRIGFAGWQSLLARNWQKTGAALAVLTLFALGAFGVIVLTKQKDLSIASDERVAPPPQIQFAPAPVNIPQPTITATGEDLPEIEKIKNSAPENGLNFQKAVFRKEIAALPKQTPRKRNFAQQQRRQNEIDPDGEFYALTSAGNPGEAGEDLRIVRAELSRASLFALGVNLPIENESEKIKTDLLVGADGVAKAIRFVR
ncbi:MAG: hypothetical protein M3384_10785 [Acidobacteriota bacterium]|nr:hypothetical protein [Acidobacteriota bacterium]